MELVPGIGRGEAPIHGGLSGIAGDRPRPHLPSHSLYVGQPPLQTLAAQKCTL